MRIQKEISKKNINRLYIIIHALAWSMIFLIPFAFFENSLFNKFYIVNIIMVLKAIILFYLNYFIFVPKILLNKRIGLFLISITILIASNIFINKISRVYFGFIPNNHHQKIKNQRPGPNDFTFKPFLDEPDFRDRKPFPNMKLFAEISFSLVLLGVSTSLRLAEELFKNKKNQEKVHHEHLTTELSFLKAQINPHFLFNSLNSIYSLAFKKSDLAPEAIVRLSKIMRYVIDDSNSTKVSIDKELEHLSDYIELQKLRFTSKTKLSFSIENNSHNASIEPMLLVPFIENAFKHGIDSVNDSVILIKIKVQDNVLKFKCSNTIARQKTETEEAETGIGFKNVKRRLDLLYPNTYKLKVLKDKLLYSINLTLTLRT